MKKILKIYLCVGMIGILLMSCTATNKMTLSVIEPAPVMLPKHIQSIGIINRSLASQENKVADEIDKIFSAEGRELDSKGAEKVILGLYDELNANGKFENIIVIVDDAIKSPGLGVFPAKLDWELVSDLCSKNDVDILYVLSFFDTDSKIDYNTISSSKQTPVGVKIPIIEHEATVNTVIKIGWRIYDPATKIVYDEYIMNRSLLSKGRGINPVKAVEAILGRKEQVLDVSTELGELYGIRIFPYRIRVARDYYVKGTPNFEIAKRRAQTGDWTGAANLWKKEINHPNFKIAGRACYNMAINNEIDGNLEKALEWASKSYTDYNNKTALRYVNILKDRINKKQILAVQNQ